MVPLWCNRRGYALLWCFHGAFVGLWCLHVAPMGLWYFRVTPVVLHSTVLLWFHRVLQCPPGASMGFQCCHGASMPRDMQRLNGYSWFYPRSGSMMVPWCFRGASMTLPSWFGGGVCASMVLPWCFHGAVMDSHGAPRVLSWTLVDSMVLAWCFHGEVHDPSLKLS